MRKRFVGTLNQEQPAQRNGGSERAGLAPASMLPRLHGNNPCCCTAGRHTCMQASAPSAARLQRLLLICRLAGVQVTPVGQAVVHLRERLRGACWARKPAEVNTVSVMITRGRPMPHHARQRAGQHAPGSAAGLPLQWARAPPHQPPAERCRAAPGPPGRPCSGCPSRRPRPRPWGQRAPRPARSGGAAASTRTGRRCLGRRELVPSIWQRWQALPHHTALHSSQPRLHATQACLAAGRGQALLQELDAHFVCHLVKRHVVQHRLHLWTENKGLRLLNRLLLCHASLQKARYAPTRSRMPIHPGCPAAWSVLPRHAACSSTNQAGLTRSAQWRVNSARRSSPSPST